MVAEDSPFSSNSASYSQRQVTQEQLRATQEELATKIKELQIYEANYIQLKKDLTRWKKKFEYIFRENELLSLETAKLDAAHKQISFLQQEIKFKEEEGTALRGLVSALEASNKKARASRLDSVARLAGRKDLPPAAVAGAALLTEHSTAAVSSSDGNSTATKEALENLQREHEQETERHLSEIAALKSENSMLLKDLDRKEVALQLKEETIAAHKERILCLEQSLKEEQDTHLEKLKEKQDEIADLELQMQNMVIRHRSSSAAAMMDRYENEQEVDFGPTGRLKSAASDAIDEEDESPDTPPGTPPPISAGGLLPPEDPNADHITRDWTDDRRIRALASPEFNQERFQQFIDKLPYEARVGAGRILLDSVHASETGENIGDALILIRQVPKELQKELQEYIVPLLKAYHNIRVKYATMERRTLVTDVRITLEPRRNSCTGGVLPHQDKFGKDHAFYGPANDDVAKLVPHTARVLTTANKAIYVSKPVKVEQPQTSNEEQQAGVEEQRSSGEQQQLETASNASTAGSSTIEGGDENAPVVNRKWRGMSVQTVKLLGTIAAGAKQRVAAKFNYSKYVHEGTSCQFCKVSPIVGPRYSCGTCVGFDLCDNCYSLGGHGLENSDELFYRVQELALARCPRLAVEVDLLELMRFEICRSNLRKFSFCLNWIADIINGKTSRELQARALEIPGIRRDVRKLFVPLLMKVCSDRTDIEVKTEWELESDNSAEVRSVVRGSQSEGDGKFLETLRIWVADQYLTTSPFVERSLLKYREGLVVEDGDDDDNEEGLDDKKMDSDSVLAAHAKPPLAKRASSSSGDTEVSTPPKRGFMERPGAVRQTDEF